MFALAIDASHSGQSRKQPDSGAVCLFASRPAASAEPFGQSGSQQRFLQVVPLLGAVRAVRGKCICHGLSCVIEFGLVRFLRRSHVRVLADVGGLG